MAGHSKWASIKHKKAAVDAKRGKIFTRIARDITTAARMGNSGDPQSNASLRLVLEKAKAANMPKDQIERAIKRGTGELKGDDYVERTYEGYGVAGVAVIVKTLTDNPTRTVTLVRTAFSKNGGNMGNDGAVAWMFDERGQIWYPANVVGEDAMLEAAIEAGAMDVKSDDEYHEIITEVADFTAVRDALEAKFGEAEEAELTYVPNNMSPVADLETAKKMMKLIDALEAEDDVQTVVTNMDVSTEVDAQLAEAA